MSSILLHHSSCHIMAQNRHIMSLSHETLSPHHSSATSWLNIQKINDDKGLIMKFTLNTCVKSTKNEARPYPSEDV